MNTTYNEILKAADMLGVSPRDTDPVPGYEALQMVLEMAYQQASSGKGKDRHSSNGLSDRPFHSQPMQTESDEIGSFDGLVYQVRKKTREGAKLPTDDRKINEWLGAINYLAGCIIWTLRHHDPDQLEEVRNTLNIPAYAVTSAESVNEAIRHQLSPNR